MIPKNSQVIEGQIIEGIGRVIPKNSMVRHTVFGVGYVHRSVPLSIAFNKDQPGYDDGLFVVDGASQVNIRQVEIADVVILKYPQAYVLVTGAIGNNVMWQQCTYYEVIHRVDADRDQAWRFMDEVMDERDAMCLQLDGGALLTYFPAGI